MTDRSTEDALAVLGYLDAQRHRLRDGTATLRAGDPSAIHDTRVAVRRSRSTLRIFDGVFVDPRGAALGRRLRVYATELGGLRDLQVLCETLTDEAPAGLMRELEPELRVAQDREWARVAQLVARPSVDRLLADVDRLVDRGTTDDVNVRKRARKAARKARRRLADAGDDLGALHRARKAAKRARYAAEALGRHKKAAVWSSVQASLGAHRDYENASEHVVLHAWPPEFASEAAELVARLRATAVRARHGVD